MWHPNSDRIMSTPSPALAAAASVPFSPPLPSPPPSSPPPPSSSTRSRSRHAPTTPRLSTPLILKAPGTAERRRRDTASPSRKSKNATQNFTPSTRLYRPRTPVEGTGSKLIPTPFAYLAAPVPTPPPQNDGYVSNVHKRAEAYMASRMAQIEAKERELANHQKNIALEASTGSHSTEDHRPPPESFDEYLEEFHETFTPPDSRSPERGESRRVTFQRLQARARRLKMRQMGLALGLDDGGGDDEDDEENDDFMIDTIPIEEEYKSNSTDPTLLTMNAGERIREQMNRRKLRREQRQQAERERRHAEEERRRKEQHFSLLASFNTQMKAAEQAELTKVIGAQAASVSAAASAAAAASSSSSTAAADSTSAVSSPAPQLHLDFAAAAVLTTVNMKRPTPLTVPNSHAANSAGSSTIPTPSNATSFPATASMNGNPSAGTGLTSPMNSSQTFYSSNQSTNSFILPIVLPGAPPFHFDPSQSSSSSTHTTKSNKSISRNEERKRELAFEKEKRELLSFLLGRPPSISSNLKDAGRLKPIVEERPSTTAANQRRKSTSPPPHRRNVEFRRNNSLIQTARPRTSSSIPSSAQTDPIAPPRVPMKPFGRDLWHPIDYSAKPHLPPTPTNSALARQKKTKHVVHHHAYPRTLTLESKRELEKNRRMRILFNQVCGGVTLNPSSSKSNLAEGSASTVAAIARDEPTKYGFGLDLSVDELSRNVKQEQRLIRGLTATVDEEPQSGKTSNLKSSLKSAPSDSNIHEPASAKVTGTLSVQTSKSNLHQDRETTTIITSTSKDPETIGENDTSTDMEESAATKKAEKQEKEKAKRLAAVAATGEYTPISPEFVNALLKATKRGDATMIATLIEQVPQEQRMEFINMKDKNGSTPIFHTVWPGHFFALRTLLQAGADPNIQNVKRNTALHLAVERGHLNLMKLLLEYKADYTLPNYEGKLCYHTPAKEEDRVLMERWIMNTSAEVKRGVKSNFKLDIAALTPAPANDPFNPKFYQCHGYPHGEERTLLAADKVESEELREIMALKPVVEQHGVIQGNPLTMLSRPSTSFSASMSSSFTSRPNTSMTTGRMASPTRHRSTNVSPIRPFTTPAAADASLNSAMNDFNTTSSTIPTTPHTPYTNSLNLPAPHPWFNRFMSKSLRHQWPHVFVRARPKGFGTATLVSEQKMYRRWARQTRRETRARKKREKEERRARNKNRDQWATRLEDEDESKEEMNESSKTTTSRGVSAYCGSSHRGTSAQSTVGSHSRETSAVPHTPLQQAAATVEAGMNVVMTPTAAVDASNEQQFPQFDESLTSSGGGVNEDDDDDFTASDDEFESLLPALPNGERPKSGPRSRPRSVRAQKLTDIGSQATATIAKGRSRSRPISSENRKVAKHPRSRSRPLSTSNSRPLSGNRMVDLVGNRIEPNTSEDTAIFAFHPSTEPSINLSANAVRLLPQTPSMGLDLVLSNRVTQMIDGGGLNGGATVIAKEPFGRIQVLDELTPQQPRMLGSDENDNSQPIFAQQSPTMSNNNLTASSSFQSQPSSIQQPEMFQQLDATVGSPMMSIDNPGFVQPLSQRFGLTSNSLPNGTSSTLASPSVPGASILAPPFAFSDDFGARSRWVTALSQPERGVGRARTRMAAEEWKEEEMKPPPTANITPSTYPVSYPYTASDRIRPVVSLLTAPSLVAKAEDFGIIKPAPPTPGSPPRRLLKDYSPTRSNQATSVSQPPSLSLAEGHPPPVPGSAAWHAQQFSALPTQVSQASVPALSLTSFSDQTAPHRAMTSPSKVAFNSSLLRPRTQQSLLPTTTPQSMSYLSGSTTTRITTAPTGGQRINFEQHEQTNQAHHHSQSAAFPEPPLYSSFPVTKPATPNDSRLVIARPPVPIAPKSAWGQVIPQRLPAPIPPNAVIIQEGREYQFATTTQTTLNVTSHQPTHPTPPSTGSRLVKSTHTKTPQRPKTQGSARTPSSGLSIIAARFVVAPDSLTRAGLKSTANGKTPNSNRHSLPLTEPSRSSNGRQDMTNTSLSNTSTPYQRPIQPTYALPDETSLYLHPAAMQINSAR